ncbi:hypothetical protein V6R86_01835 [Sphingomonas kaistensis]|uniref:GIY-YIG nuclease family protein n=1 Tax=Sphingomonas kaistensis TaxID=298708 RepID=A0ABZ2FXT7_9SPHN
MKIELNWVTMPDWYRAGFVGLSKSNGLFRVRLHGETVFLGYAETGGLTARLRAYKSPKGTGQNHHAGRLIYERRADVEMQIAVIAAPPEQIHQLYEAERRKCEPPWNVADERSAGRKRVRN